MMEKPTNLLEAIPYFSDVDVSTDYVAGLRWPDGFVCPLCGGREYSYVSTRRLWKCKSCQKQSSVKVGTIFEGSALGLDKWLPAIWLAANSQNAISSHELARALGTTQKSAWFMLRRIGEAATAPTPSPAEPTPTPVDLPPPTEDGRPRLPGARYTRETRPWLLLALALAFALGAAVGRLSNRVDGRTTIFR